MEVAAQQPHIEETKLFLGGLPQESSIDTLKQYFLQFGDVKEVEIMTDPVTKRSRGFGFVKFDEREPAQKILARGKDHLIDGKTIEIKVAYRKGEEAAVQEIIHNRKIFVGGLTKESTEDKLKEYFSTYGMVVSVDIKKEKGTDAIRGFGFVEFSSKDAVDVLLLNPIHTICGKQMEVKKVEPKEKTRPAHKLKSMHGYDNSGGSYGRGGGGGARGRGNNYFQPYGGHYTYGGNNNNQQYGPGGGQYQGGMYGGGPNYGAGYGADGPAGYGGPPPPGPPPPGQYGYPPQPQGRGTATGYNQQQPGAYAQDGSGYTPAARPGYTAPPPPGGEVTYPQNVGYTGYDQSAGYQQQQPIPQQPAPQQYYDPSQQGANQPAGYGRGAPQAQRGGYYGGQWTS